MHQLKRGTINRIAYVTLEIANRLPGVVVRIFPPFPLYEILSFS